MAQYFLGVDIGGTKSHAVIADDTGCVIGFGQAGPGNYESVGWDGLQNALHTIVDAALLSAGIAKDQLSGAGFGIAGYDWPLERQPTLAVIETIGLHTPVGLVNDAVIALLAGASEGWGVAVIAGTGCNACGRDLNGKEGRVTGGGIRFGEYAGSYELVFRAIQAVSMAWSNRGPETSLLPKFIEYVGAEDAVDLFHGLSVGRYQLKSRTAPLVFEAAAEGDGVALELIHWAGRGLGNLAVGIIRQLAFEALGFEVVLAGSFYKGQPSVTETMLETVHALAPAAKFVHLTASPVLGGVVLGMEQVGLRDPALRENLIASLDAFYMSENESG